MTAEDIATALDRPSGTVRTQVVRGLERLRHSLPKGFVGGSLLLGLASPSLVSVRRVVLSQVPAAASIAVGPSLVGGLMAMKPLTGAVAVMAVAGATWVLWRNSEKYGPPADQGSKSSVTAEQQFAHTQASQVSGTLESPHGVATG